MPLVIPVIDIKGGQVVRAIAGKRREYQPIRSRLAPDSRPTTVATAFAQLGFVQVYVADLDAIEGLQPAWNVYRALAACGLDLWIDAGISTTTAAKRMAQLATGGEDRVTGIIVGLESLPQLDLLGQWLDVIGRERLIFSLDLCAGQPVTQIDAWRSHSAAVISRAVIDVGVRQMIVLDLARVGVGQGAGTENLCRAIRAYSPDLKLTAGGGVRGPQDVARLADAGCDAVLVASALHDGGLAFPA